MLQSCSDPGLAYLLFFVKRFLNVIQIIGPIVALVGLTIHLIKLMTNPEDKKNKPLIKNWLIALLLLFFVPVIINLVMTLLDGKFDLPTCWNEATDMVVYNNT